MYAALAADAAQYDIIVPALPPTISPIEAPSPDGSSTLPMDATASPPPTE
jgi:hypothetical protein